MTTPIPETASTQLDLRLLAQQQAPLQGATPIAVLERLADLPPLAEAGLAADESVRWTVQAEWRERLPGHAPAETKGAPVSGQQLWLHLLVSAHVPQMCQRCLSPYPEMVDIDRWFRFVADEAAAAAEDDESEEDLLVWQPKFNLHELIEDELLMALPLVPMHEICPQPLPMSVGESELEVEQETPHPFASLVALKGKPTQK